MKTLLFLGGNHAQIPPMKAAKAMGHHVVLVDANLDNPGKQVAHEYFYVSTTDEERVLSLAKDLAIDGIVAYASDPAAYTAAYVAAKLGLPGNPPDSVYTLTHKDFYRSFLNAKAFHTPRLIPEGYDEPDTYPVVIKPVDSSGSKGVTVARNETERAWAIKNALTFSRCKRVVVEEFIKKKGYQIAGDGFVVNGKLVFRCFGNEHFDEDGLVPIGESFPSVLPEVVQRRMHDEVQALIDLLKLRDGALNFDIMLDKNEDVFLMEIGPRNGGNLIPEVTKYATGVDMVEATIKTALGEDCGYLKMAPVKGYWASYIIHAREDGVFKTLKTTWNIRSNIVELNMYVKEGDHVKKFNGSNCTLGMAILKFGSEKEMLNKMRDMRYYIEVVLDA